jgi:hypothetical protein
MKRLSIIPLEERIVFNADIPVSGVEGTPISFNADAFFPGHPTDGSATYSWDFDNNGTYESGPTSNAVTTKSFVDNGIYNISGRMSIAGQSDVFQAGVVTVANATPTLNLPPVQGLIPVKGFPWVFIAGAAAKDLGVIDALVATINWGDGTPTQLAQILMNQGPGNAPDGTTVGIHTYQTSGPVTVTVTVTDKDGASVTKTTNVNISTDPSLFRLPGFFSNTTNNANVQKSLANSGDNSAFVLGINVAPATVSTTYAYDSSALTTRPVAADHSIHETDLLKIDQLHDSWFKSSADGQSDSAFSFRHNKLQLFGDPEKVYTLTLTVKNGEISIADTAGLTFAEGDPTRDSRLTLTGTLKDINRAMEGMTYINQSDLGFTDRSPASITISVKNDNSSSPSETTRTVALSFVPELRLGTVELNYDPHKPLLLASDASFADNDAKTYAGGVLIVDFVDPAGQDSGQPADHLGILAKDGILVVGNEVHVNGVPVAIMRDGTGGKPLVIEFNAQSTPGSVQQVMQRLDYSNTGEKLEGHRVARVTVVDQDGNSRVK